MYSSSPKLVFVRLGSLLPPPRVVQRLGTGEHDTQNGEVEQKRTTGVEERPGNPPVKRQALWGQTGRKDVAGWAGQGPMCPTVLPADPDFLELSPHFGSF